jgi:CRP-like cAMP-binding protein
MQLISTAIKQIITIPEEQLNFFLQMCSVKKFKRKEVVSYPGHISREIFFINKGLIRVVITDNQGMEHSIHFALENQFIADYSSFLLKQPSLYKLQTEEETDVVVLPREAIEWGYNNMAQGDRLGRKIAEFYFIYQDNRIKNLYARTPKERYEAITDVFPNLHNRVPQHMIASYLGISPVHLSRLKKAVLKKI